MKLLMCVGVLAAPTAIANTVTYLAEDHINPFDPAVGGVCPSNSGIDNTYMCGFDAFTGLTEMGTFIDAGLPSGEVVGDIEIVAYGACAGDVEFFLNDVSLGPAGLMPGSLSCSCQSISSDDAIPQTFTFVSTSEVAAAYVDGGVNTLSIVTSNSAAGAQCYYGADVTITSCVTGVGGCPAVATTTMAATEPPAHPVYQDQIGQCDGTAFCTIETYEDCEEGIYALGYDQLPHLGGSVVVNTQTNSRKVAGCSSRNKALGTFVFNDLLSSTAVHKSTKDKRVICKKCPDAPEFVLQDFACDLETYCIIEDQATCETAGAAVGYTDTQPRVGSWTNKNAGCSTNNAGGLRFNTNLASTYVHGNTNRFAVCQICDGKDKYVGATISPCADGSPC